MLFPANVRIADQPGSIGKRYAVSLDQSSTFAFDMNS